MNSFRRKLYSKFAFPKKYDILTNRKFQEPFLNNSAEICICNWVLINDDTKMMYAISYQGPSRQLSAHKYTDLFQTDRKRCRSWALTSRPTYSRLRGKDAAVERPQIDLPVPDWQETTRQLSAHKKTNLFQTDRKRRGSWALTSRPSFSRLRGNEAAVERSQLDLPVQDWEETTRQLSAHK